MGYKHIDELISWSDPKESVEKSILAESNRKVSENEEVQKRPESVTFADVLKRSLSNTNFESEQK